MGILNTAMNAVGTVAALKSLVGKKPASGASGKLNDFLTTVRQGGVAKSNLFDVKVTPPKVLTGDKNSQAARKLSLLGKVAQLPGYYIQTTDVARYGFGPQEKTAYGTSYNDITIKFIGDGKGEIYKFFYNWIQGIVRGDIDPTTGKIDSNAKGAYEVEFREDYAVDVDITTYDEQGESILLSRMVSAYPVNITELELDWGSEDIMEFSVQFTFRRAQIIGSEELPQDSKNGIQGLSTLQKLVKIGTAVQVLSSIKRPRNIQEALSSASTVKNIF